MNWPAELRGPIHDAQGFFLGPFIPMHMALQANDVDIDVVFPHFPQEIEIFFSVHVPIAIEQFGIGLIGTHQFCAKFHHIHRSIPMNPPGNRIIKAIVDSGFVGKIKKIKSIAIGLHQMGDPACIFCFHFAVLQPFGAYLVPDQGMKLFFDADFIRPIHQVSGIRLPIYAAAGLIVRPMVRHHCIIE